MREYVSVFGETAGQDRGSSEIVGAVVRDGRARETRRARTSIAMSQSATCRRGQAGKRRS